MSFRAYPGTIELKTGKGPQELQAFSDARGHSEKGKLEPDTRARQIAGWLKAEFGLGYGHAMAVHALLSGKKKPGD